MLTPTMTEMAIAVLRGDEAAALALADTLCERRSSNVRQFPPVKEVTVSRDRLRVVCRTYECLGGDVNVDIPAVREAVDEWLDSGQVLLLCGMTLELYEFPEGFSDD